MLPVPRSCSTSKADNVAALDRAPLLLGDSRSVPGGLTLLHKEHEGLAALGALDRLFMSGNSHRETALIYELNPWQSC